MGFMEGLGRFLGSMAGTLEEWQKQANLYRPEYEKKSNQELKTELQKLKNDDGLDRRARQMAINMILNERGALQKR